jgi:tRNA A-37 threonylcarbamoyl transferase component Bud32
VALPAGASAAGPGRPNPYAESPADRTEVWSEPSPKAKTKPAAQDRTDAGGPPPDETEAEAGAPKAMGGYEILKPLGRGGMGTVYLARQVSLDRPVALKVMNPKWARDPAFLARFTREAYAAAQLTHHHIVQIYDIGEQGGAPFFSMEYVQGKNLAEVVRSEGKLDVEAAVGYVLQAARGLKFAHDFGMVHRDVKPDNLMLNEQGLVKVADLGLVKTPGADDAPPAGAAPPRPLSSALASLASVTHVGSALGTPAYMAPEQGRNAAAVDHRADIYSLGCTLYVLLTGQPPFHGHTAMEVLTKHLTEPVVPPEQVVKRVPHELSEVVLRMLAKDPAQRYQNLGEVIRDLESFLGVTSSGVFTPKEEHAGELEACVKAFNAAPSARLRARVWPAFLGACGVLVLLTGLLGWPRIAVGVLALGAFTALGVFVVQGVAYRTHLFAKVRGMVLGATWTDWLTWGVTAVFLVLAAYLFKLLGVAVGAVIVAAALVGAYHSLVSRKLAAERAASLERAEKLLRGLRLHGLEEEALRQFVAKYAGEQWEEFYEALFGYEALLKARQHLLGESGRRRPQHAAWRDPLVRWIDARQQSIKEAKERKLLQKVEQKGMEAKGVSAAEARERAEEAAEAMVEQAAGIKKHAARPAAATRAGSPDVTTPHFDARTLRAAAARAEADQAARVRGRRRSPVRRLVRAAFGPRLRFVVGVVLLGACAWWVHQNWEAVSSSTEKAAELAAKAAERRDLEGVQEVQNVQLSSKPLELPFLPERVAETFFNSFNAGLAGLLLILSAFGEGRYRLVLFEVAGAVIMFAGAALGVPDVAVPGLGTVAAQHISLVGGLAVAVVGFVFDRLT